MEDNELQGLKLEDLLLALEGADRSDATPFVTEIVRRFEPLLRRGWKRMSLDLDYEDFAQEVFLRLFSSLHRLRERKAFPGYFRRIVTSVALDLARQKRLARFEDELDPTEIVSDIDRNLLGALYVRSYLEHLPEREAEILALTFLDGLDTAEIAHLLRLAHGSVRATKFRGIRRLRSILNSEAVELEKLARKG